MIKIKCTFNRLLKFHENETDIKISGSFPFNIALNCRKPKSKCVIRQDKDTIIFSPEPEYQSEHFNPDRQITVPSR